MLAIGILFFLSGFCGLTYEVLWVRWLTPLFGNTVYAVSAVLCAFMAGLALGSLSFGRLVERKSRPEPLRLYALLEAGIGLWALLLVFLLPMVNPLYLWVAGYFPASSEGWLMGIRFIFSLTLLMVPTTLMGATLPVLTKEWAPHQDLLGRPVALLYAVNTWGAASGCMATGFVLIEGFGLTRSALLASGINFGVALLALFMARQRAQGRALATSERQMPEVEAPGSLSYGPRTHYIVFFAISLAGFTALSYEVLWTKALILFIGNSVYSFATVLATFLIGIALGSNLFPWLMRRRRGSVSSLGLVESLIGFLGFLSLPLFAIFFTRGREWVEAFGLFSWWMSVGTGFLWAFLIMLLPTTLMGFAFPLACKIYASCIKRVGQGVGDIYFGNTSGAIFGSVVSSFFILPVLGLQRSIVAVSLINLFIGLAMMVGDPGGRGKKGSRLRASLVAFSLVTLLLGMAMVGFDTSGGESSGYEGVSASSFERLWHISSHIMPYLQSRNGERLLFYEESPEAIVSVKAMAGDKALFIDEQDVAGTDAGYVDTQKMLGHLPMLLHPEPKRAFVLGLGAGGASSAILQHEGLERLDCAELVGSVAKAVHHLEEVNKRVWEEPRFHLFINDGRNFLLTAQGKYDVISIDLLYPQTAGSGSLYTREFYQLCRERLNPDGIICQWLPPHRLFPEDLEMVVRTFQSVFPHATLWFARHYSNLILVGSLAPLKIDFPTLKERMEEERVKRDLAEASLDDPSTMVNYFITGGEGMTRYVGGSTKLNTDDHPYIEFRAPRLIVDRSSAGFDNFRLHCEIRQSVIPLLENLSQEEREKLSLLERSTEIVFRGKLQARQANLERAKRFFELALKINPDDQEAQYHRHMVKQEVEESQKRFYMAALKAMKEHPEDPRVHHSLGYLLYQRGLYPRAVNELLKAIELKGDFGLALFHLGMTYMALDQEEAAEEAFLKAKAADPSLKEVVERKITLLTLEQQRKTGLLDEVSRRKLALLYMQDEQWDKAEVECLRLIEQDPGDTRAYMYITHLYREQGRHQEAVDMCRKLLTHSPGNSFALSMMNRLQSEFP